MKTKKPISRGMTMAGKNSVTGYLFIAPFVIGFIAFMALPLYQAVRMAFSHVSLDLENNTFSMTWLSRHRAETVPEAESFLTSMLTNFRRAFQEDPDFNEALFVEFLSLAYVVVPVLIFSLFIAVLLNRKFVGRSVVRAIFFLPVILASGVLVGIESNNSLLIDMQQQLLEQNAMRAGVTGVIERMLENMVGGAGFGVGIEIMLSMINQIYTIAMASGIQILIFLAGLQTINPSIYEAASIEGATAWENFWKITFPMISPMILVVIVYSVIDFMVRTDGQIMEMVAFAMRLNEYGFSSAMAISYFAIIAVVLGLLGLIISRLVYYYD
jgi:ABC-type sugar transport system permease subunit